LKGVWVPAVPNAIVGEVKKWAEVVGVDSISIPAYWMEKKGTDLPLNARPAPGENVLLVFHGGAYAVGSACPSSSNSVANVPRGILQHAGPSLRRALVIEYRLSKDPSQQPSHPFPAALLDAIAGYKYLVDEVGFAPENIIIEGDSAGGNLALALVRYLIDNRGTDGIPPVPGGLILVSPWSDFGPEPTDPQSSIHTCEAADITTPFVRSDGANVLNFLGPHGKEAAVTNPYISPASLAPTMPPVSFDGYPRTFIANGGAEILRDQIRVLRDRMEASKGLKVKYVEPPHVWHDFLMFPVLEPERTDVLKMIRDWVEE
jgi:acetyl esterase/lipase